MKYTQPKCKIGDEARIAKNDMSFRKGYKLHFKDEMFEASAISTKKPPTYIIKDLKKVEILGKFL